MSAKNNQIGGDHYRKLAIQPMEYALKNNLNYAQSNAIKYITRYKDKGGIHDLHKAIHCIELLIQHESEAQSIAAGWTPEAIEAAAFKDACAEVEWPDESRIDIIGPNGNEGLHYDQKTWQLNYGERPDLPAGTLVEVSFRHQCPLGICDVSDVDIVDMWQWALSGSDWDIISWRIATQEKP